MKFAAYINRAYKEFLSLLIELYIMTFMGHNIPHPPEFEIIEQVGMRTKSTPISSFTEKKKLLAFDKLNFAYFTESHFLTFNS